MARLSIATTLSASIGFSRKYEAPALIASTARGMLPCPLMTSTSVRGCKLFETADELGAADIWQDQIDQRGVGQPRREQLFGFGAAGRDPRFISGASDDGREPVGHIRLVVNHQHASHPVEAHDFSSPARRMSPCNTGL